MISAALQTDSSRWPRRLAVALACATFPLVCVGGLVTTYKEGMAVPDWPSTYGYNLFLYPLDEWFYGPWGLFIEHFHRLIGATVGMLTIALATVVWRCDRRKSMRILSLLVVAAVVGQGILGGMRVEANKIELARIHACTGPMFFALTVVFAALIAAPPSDRSKHSSGGESKQSMRLATLSTIMALLVLGQIILGAYLRHLPAGMTTDVFRTFVFFHLATAAALLLHGVALAVASRRLPTASPRMGRMSAGLAALICVQIGLGCAVWVLKYSWPAWLGDHAWTAGYVVEANSLTQAGVTTAHVAVGSLLLALAATIVLRSWQAVAISAPLAASFYVAQRPAWEGAG